MDGYCPPLFTLIRKSQLQAVNDVEGADPMVIENVEDVRLMTLELLSKATII